MNLGHSIRKNTSWILGGNVTGKLIGFFVGIVLARLLVPADFGMLVTIQIFTGAIGFIAGAGMGDALVQAKEVDTKDFHVVFTLQFTICIAIYLIFYLIAPWFSVWFNEPLYEPLLQVSAINFLLRPIQNIHRSQLRREMRFKEITMVRMATIFSTSTASILMAFYHMGPWSLVLGGIAGGLTNAFFLSVVTKYKPEFWYDSDTAKRLGSYGVKVSANAIIDHLRSQTSNLIISRVLGASHVGLFNKADSLALLPYQMITSPVYQTVFRGLSSVQDNLDQSKYIYFRTITLVTVYTLPFYIGLLWLSEPFIVSVYGQKWSAAALPLQIIALTGIFRCIINPSGAVIAAQNRLGYEFRINLETWGILIIGCLIGVRWGIVGVAWSIIPSIVFNTFRMSSLANKCIHGKYSDLFRALTPAAIMNGGLMLILGLTHFAMPDDSATQNPAIYLATMSAVGGLFYGLVFLYAPIEALSAEAMRWKRKLKLA